MPIDGKFIINKLINTPFIYHYTSVDALFSILEGCRKSKPYHTLPFWAGCVYNSNDSREMELGYETVKSILPQYEKSFANSINLSEVYEKSEYEVECKKRFFQRPKDGFVEMSSVPYTLSFSSKRDFLPMWAMYGNNKRGVCLKFSLSSLVDGINKESCFVHYENSKDNVIKDCLLPSLYDFTATCTKKNNKVMSIEDKIEELSLLCDCISPYIKSGDWAYESEFRIVSYEHYGPKYKKSFSGLHLSLDKTKIENHVTIPVPANSLKEVIIGPLANYDVLEHILRNELKECNLNYVEITPSSIHVTK